MSTTIALEYPRALAAPISGSVRTAELPARSLIVPASEAVEA